MPGKLEEKVKFVCVKLKPNEHPEKARCKILKGLRNAEKKQPRSSAICYPLAEWCEKVHLISELDAKEVLEVASNSRYVVFLMRDGRVCRIKCSSKAETSTKTSVDILKKTSQPSLQELSDAEYARQLQATFDSEGERRSLGGLQSSATVTASPSLVDLDRRARELMFLGSVPSPEYNRDPEYYGNLARSLSHQEELVTGIDIQLTPPPAYESLPSIVPERTSSPRLHTASNLFGASSSLAATGGGGVGGVRGDGVQRKDKVSWPDMGGVEWMITKENPDCPSLDTKFVAMATLHSEILLVSAGSRQLYSWSCDGTSPSPTPHPLTGDLRLTGERIAVLGSSDVRATIVTESGKVATFYDCLLRTSSAGTPPPLIQSLTHAAQEYPQLKGDSMEQLSVSNFITVATTRKGKVVWWGLCPQQPSLQASGSNNHSPTRPTTTTTSSSSTTRGAATITDGSLVRLKHGPPCGPNTVVYTRSATHGPRVGKTMNIIEHSTLDPKTSILVKVFKDGNTFTKDVFSPQSGTGDVSSKPPLDLDDSQLYDGVEVWKLSDIVFLDDSPSILGRVVTVDQNQAIVDISPSEDTSLSSETQGASNSEKSKNILKVFKLSELELCIGNRFTNSSSVKPEPSSIVQISFLPSGQTSTNIFIPAPQSVTHHVAGVVQHLPICILDSSRSALRPPPPVGGSNWECEGGATTVIRGYKVLAIHAADDGPRMMVERYSDGKAFLIGSAHANTGWLIGTSYVARSATDSRPNRCTLEEESVCAVDRGIAPDYLIDALSQSKEYEFKPTPSGEAASELKGEVREGDKSVKEEAETKGQASEAKPQIGQKRKLDDATGDENLSPTRNESSDEPILKPATSSTSDATERSSFSSSSSSQDLDSKPKIPPFRITKKSYSIIVPASFISCYNSQVIFFHDVNGIICPMADGLCLKPVTAATPGGGGGGGRSQRVPPQPQLSYRSVLSRQLAISKDTSVLVFVLVPRPRTLMPSVLAGHMAGVDAVLTHIKKKIDAIPRDSEDTDQVSDPSQGTNSEVELEGDLGTQDKVPSPDSIPEPVSDTLTSQPSSELSSAQDTADEEMVEVGDAQPGNSSALTDLPESSTPVLSTSTQAAVVKENSETSAPPQTKRMRFSNPVEVTLPMVPPPVVGSQNQDSVLVKPVFGTALEQGSQEESLSSFITPPIDIDIDFEIPVVKKNDAAPSVSKTTRGRDQQPSGDCSERERSELEGCDVVDQPVECGPEVVFEATVNNANILHLCCQLEGSAGGGGAAKSVRSEMREATRVFKPHIVDRLRYQSITALPEFSTKSFDELRFAHISQQPEGGLTVGKGSSIAERGLIHRRMATLKKLLTCRQIRPFIIKLLNSKNGDGHTPFMEAISQHNYSAALQILQFVEEHDKKELASHAQTSGLTDLTSLEREEQSDLVFYPPLEILMETAILTPSGNGTTPIEAVFSSLSPLFDSDSMCLYVSNMPMNYTAQQLLKLFQTRYPSAYKAEMFKVEDGDSSSSGSSSEFTDEEEEEEEETMQQNGDFPPLPRLFGNRRRRPLTSELRRRARRHRFTSTFYSSGPSSNRPTNGVVYFSSVTQLRAALKEMHDFRLVSNLSRVTGYGQTQSISYLSVSLEPPTDSEEDDVRDFLEPFDAVQFEFGSTSSRLVGLRRRERDEEGPRKKALHGNEFSSPQLAYQLLTRLLTHTDVAIATDKSGETALSAVVHNRKCLVALDGLLSPPHTTNMQAQIRNFATISELVQNRNTSGLHTIPLLSSDIGVGIVPESPTTTSTGAKIAPYASLSEIPHDVSQHSESKPEQKFFPFSLPSQQPVSSSGVLSFAVDGQIVESTSTMPTTEVQRLKEPLRFGQPATQKSDKPAMKPDLLEKTPAAGLFGSSGEADEKAKKVSTLESDSSASSDKPTPNQPPGSVSMESNALASGTTDPSASSGKRTADRTTTKLSATFTPVTHEAEGTTPMEVPLSSSPQEESTSSCSGTCDLLSPLVTNWPCIVTTILGYYPFKKLTDYNFKGVVTPQEKEKPKYQPARLSSVHLLDSFTLHLILNCKDSVISSLVRTIVDKMSAVLEGNCDLSVLAKPINSLEVDLKKMDEATRTLLVGKRFLESVVRVLALEHSRVRNAFVELHQQRQGVGEGVRGGRGGGRSGRGNNRPGQDLRRKNVVETIKTILHPFSWLAVHSLAESAEASSAPVRLGISKPLGANSVVPDYHSSRQPSYRVAHHHNEDPYQSLTRQLHVRAALLLPDTSTSSPPAYTSSTFSLLPTSPLPREGLVLKPQSKDPNAISFGGGTFMSLVGNEASVHDDSFEDLDLDTQDASDHEREDVLTQNTSGSVMFPPGDAFYISDPQFPIHIQQPTVGSILVDIEPTSSDESEYENFRLDDAFAFAANSVRLGGAIAHDDSNMDEIYPFAWALDGRRIGENSTNTTRPNSPSLFTIGGTAEPTVPLCSIPSIRFGAGFLARTFSRLVKDLVDTAQTICENKTQQPCLRFPPALVQELVQSTVSTLEQTWAWVVSVLDVAEGQLQQGHMFDTQHYVLSLRSTGGGQGAPVRSIVRPSRSFIGSTPGEYITYLLRTQATECESCLPIIDLYGYEHAVYVLDSLLYTLNNWPKAATALLNQSELNLTTTNQITDQGNLNSEPNDSSEAISMETNSQTQQVKGGRFFERTESIILGEDSETHKSNEQFFGKDGASLDKAEFVGPPNPWGQQIENFSRPLTEDYPLAQQPHLLKPYAKKEQLFSPTGRKGSDAARGGNEGQGEENTGRGRRKLPVSYAQQKMSLPTLPLTLTWSLEHALQRWHSTISVFAHIFLAEGPGSERSNFLNARAGFASRMARFRHQVLQLFEASQSHRDWSSAVSNTLSIRVRREQLMQDTLDTLQQMVRFHYSQIRVKFEGEDGSGPGVNRGLFASLANELKSTNTTKHPMNKVGLFFHEPGKHPEQSGLYSPCPFVPLHAGSSIRNAAIKAQRKNAFRAVGRFIGLCLWFRYTVPFMVCRHVAKYLLGRELAWHDLAFYNADLYEGLRRMMLDAEEGKKSKEEFLSAYCCYFEAPLSGASTEPVLVELIPGGSKVPVTPERVQEYVRLYATFMMVGCVKEELQAMKEGLTDIIPSELLAGLTAEDFQLLLSGGSADITLSRLKSVIRFNHTHGSSGYICDRFEKMFWRVVSHMNNTQRQQLLYFATGSATLPAATDTTDRTAAVAITIDVIGGSNTESLPVASTCSQRMSIPLYPSYHILKKKLLQAIQCQAYGLG